jgi:two-component system response regulator PilR (NtrC family)
MNAPSQPARILVVDDEDDLRTLYELTLLREGYLVDTAPSLEQARRLLSDQVYDVLITDMRLDDGLGLSLLQELQQSQRRERCIVITAFGSAENAVQALKAGAFDYLTKPVDLRQFRHVVASALQQQAGPLLHTPAPVAEQALADRALARLVGDSAAMQLVRARIAKVARSMAPVHIMGESGTGKELAALAIHANSHRAHGPWVPVNCSAIPESLMEAEFFGAKKGSYTGAQQDRDGFFQNARGGTLFLDEIGDLPMSMQSKLLRAIQERSVRPLGAAQEEAVDVRIVSATHKDLVAEVKQGRFRQDLYYRLNVIDVLLPPLRERREDLPQICQALLARIAQESGQRTIKLEHAWLEQLAAMPLPGNVRELENLLHRLVTLDDLAPLTAPAPLDEASGPEAPRAPETIELGQPTVEPTRDTSPPEVPADQVYQSALGDLQGYLDEVERKILIQALEQSGFNRTLAASRLGISLRQMRYRIERLGITVPTGGPDGH